MTRLPFLSSESDIKHHMDITTWRKQTFILFEFKPINGISLIMFLDSSGLCSWIVLVISLIMFLDSMIVLVKNQRKIKVLFFLVIILLILQNIDYSALNGSIFHTVTHKKVFLKNVHK